MRAALPPLPTPFVLFILKATLERLPALPLVDFLGSEYKRFNPPSPVLYTAVSVVAAKHPKVPCLLLG